jgi:hypothetical protein
MKKMRANGEGQEFILISMHSSHFNTEAKFKKKTHLITNKRSCFHFIEESFHLKNNSQFQTLYISIWICLLSNSLSPHIERVIRIGDEIFGNRAQLLFHYKDIENV